MTKIIVIVALVIVRTQARYDIVTITKPENSIIYKQIGRLFPSLNFSHVRTNIDMSIFPNITQQICNTGMIFKQFVDWTSNDTLDHLHANIRSKFNNASYGEKYPSRPYQLQMRTMVRDMEMRCTKTNGIKELVRQLFAAKPISSELRDVYDKRFIAEAISLLFSGYNLYEKFELSSEVTALDSNQKHIIASARALETATAIMEANFEQMGDNIERLSIKSAIGTFEIHLTTAAMQASSRLEEMLQYMQQLSQGLFKVPGGKLDPLLIEPSQLHDALATLTHNAEAKGYNAISTILPHVFELQTSMYVHHDKYHVDVTTQND